MITLHSFTIRYYDKFKRWYGYTDSGLLIYLDLSICPDSDKLQAGSTYDLRGKLIPAARREDNGPIATLLVLAYAVKES